MDYDHLLWVEAVMKNIDSESDEDLKTELILNARDEFLYMKPSEKADVFVFLLGKNRSK